MKIARTIPSARKWASSFTAPKRETRIKCAHGTSTVIEILYKSEVVDSVCCCPDCWEAAKWVDKIQ